MSKLSEKLATLTPKARQYLMLGGAGAGLMALIAGSMSLMDSQPAQIPATTSSTEQQVTNIAAPGAAIDPKDVWMTQSAAQMKQMDDVIQGLKQQMSGMQAASSPSANNNQNSILPPIPPMPVASPLPPLPVLPIPSVQPDATLEVQKPRETGISSFEVSKTEPPPVIENDNSGYVPAGSFVRVALLGGLDAPTGGQAQTNPHPILMRAQDNAFLPNRFRFEIKECLLLASGYGDISSERAFGRLENLSCVRRDGRAIDIPVKGYVVGEDGKAGLRGRLISKQGQILANALLAGIGSGIGQAFQNSATTQSISPLGTTATVTAGQQLQNGVGAGVGKALDRLSKYYIDLAEKLFPVIEIDGGRMVEVVFTKGFLLDTNQTGNIEGTYSDIWRRGREIVGKSLDPNAP